MSNLLYYQTNYFLSSVLVFTLVTAWSPARMLGGSFTMAGVFCLLYWASSRQEEVRRLKESHPSLVMVATAGLGWLLVRQLGCLASLLAGLLLPVLLSLLHACLRLRNIKNKVRIVGSNRDPIQLLSTAGQRGGGDGSVAQLPHGAPAGRVGARARSEIYLIG